MDVERTMEFILQMQAKADATLAELAQTQKASDRRIDRLERNLTRMASLGNKARSELRRKSEEHDRWMANHKVAMDEITEKLNGLIGYVDRFPKNPPSV